MELLDDDASAARAVRELTEWIARGGTQDPSGAFCGWRDADTGNLSASYPEITGYALTFLSRDGLGESARSAARAAATWLIDRADRDEFACRLDKPDAGLYLFDSAMIATGLFSYGRHSGDQRAVEAGMKHVALILDTYAELGTLPPLVPGTFRPGQPAVWSTHGAAHLLKAVQALLLAARLGVSKAESVAAKLVRDSLPLSDGPGPPLPTCPVGAETSLHALCYAAEGLWIWGTCTGEQDALAASRTITRWVWRHQCADGGFPAYAPHPYSTAAQAWCCQSDVIAQAIRLAQLHRLPLDGVAPAIRRLTSSVWRGGDGTAAAYYWPECPQRHLNWWASLFAVQALDLSCAGALEWTELV